MEIRTLIESSSYTPLKHYTTTMHTAITKLSVGDRQIWLTNYGDSSETEMFVIMNDFKQILLKETEPQLILVEINDNAFVSHAFRQGADEMTRAVFSKIKKMAFAGLNEIKLTILSDYNSVMNRNFPAFRTREQAIAFLLDDSKSDRL